MKTITAGHRYELENFEAKNQPGQVIQFIEKVPVPGQPGQLATMNDGTTNEEVMKMLIDRLQSLYDKFPSEETYVTISFLKVALYAQQLRTYERQQRGVEGKHIK